MRFDKTSLDALRRRLDPLDNDRIDELATGRIDRRAFLRHGSLLGLSLPILGGIAGVFGLTAEQQAARAATPRHEEELHKGPKVLATGWRPTSRPTRCGEW